MKTEPAQQAAHTGNRISMIAFIAWRNLWRNKTRSFLTISALGGGLAMLILYTALLNGMVKQMSDFSTRISSGHLQIHHQAFIDDQDLYATISWPLIDGLRNNFADIQISPRLYGAALASSGDISSGVLLKAVDPKKEKQVTTMLSHIRQGSANLSRIQTQSSQSAINGDSPEKYFVIIGAQFAKNLSISPGDEIVLVTQAADGSIGNGLFVVSGILKPIEPAFDRTGILLSIKAYNSLMYLDSGAHELAIRADSYANEQNLISLKTVLSTSLTELQKTFPADPLSGPLIVRTWKELVPAISDMIEVSKAAVYILGMIMLGLASMGMMNTVLMSIFERKHEFGILLSLGMGRYWLLLMVMLESLFISIISVLAGTSLGIIFSFYLETYGIDMSSYMPDGFDYGGIIFEPVWYGYLDTESILIGISLTFIIATLASLIPSWKIVKMKPVEVMR